MNYTKAPNYSLSLFEKLQKEGDSITLNFESIEELDNYFVSIMENLNKNHKNEKIVMYYKYNWWPILYSQKQHKILDYDENNNRFYCINDSNTNLDKWATKFENDIGMHVKIIENFNQHFDFQVYGDIIIQFYIDSKIWKEIRTYFKETKNIRDFNLENFIDLLKKKCKITVIVIKNKILSNQLKGEVFAKFENEK